MVKKINPIVIRSRKWLTDSLLSLMKEKPYNKITIKDISEKADLTRQTFYKNFNSKNEILDMYFNELHVPLRKVIGNGKPLTLKELNYLYFSFWKKHSDFIKLLIDNDLVYLLGEHYKKNLYFFNQLYNQLYSINSSEINKYTVTFVIGGLIDVLTEWINCDMDLTIEEISDLLTKILKNIYFKNIH